MNNAVAQLDALIERIHRACLTVSTFPRAGPRGFFSTWPAYRLDWWDAEDFGSQRTDEAITKRFVAPPRFVATPREIDDALPALALLDGEAVPRRARTVIRLRAFQEWYGVHVDPSDELYAHYRGGWRAIGRMARCSHTTAQNLHHAAMVYALERQLKGFANRTAPLSKSLA